MPIPRTVVDPNVLPTSPADEEKTVGTPPSPVATMVASPEYKHYDEIEVEVEPENPIDKTPMPVEPPRKRPRQEGPLPSSGSKRDDASGPSSAHMEVPQFVQDWLQKENATKDNKRQDNQGHSNQRNLRTSHNYFTVHKCYNHFQPNTLVEMSKSPQGKSKVVGIPSLKLT